LAPHKTDDRKRAALATLADELIRDLLAIAPDISEGVVMTTGPLPYRRLDCDRRALAYIRARPRKRIVRVDVSGLWIVPSESRLRVDVSSAGCSLILRSAADKDEAIAFLLEAIQTTRTRLEKERTEEERRRARLAELHAQRPRAPRKKPPSDGSLIAAEGPPKHDKTK
jgi:hypothetical protein